MFACLFIIAIIIVCVLIRTIQILGFGLFVFIVLILFYCLPSVGTSINPAPIFSGTVKLIGSPIVDKELRPLNGGMHVFQFAKINIESTYTQQHQITLSCVLNNKPWFTKTINLTAAYTQSNDFGLGKYDLHPSNTIIVQTIAPLKDWTDGGFLRVGCKLL